MRRLITAGVAPAQAAEEAKTATEFKPITSILENFQVNEDLVDAIYRAALVFDKSFIESALRMAIAENGVVQTWQEVIAPLLAKMGDIWATTGDGIEVEHLFSEILKRVMRESIVEVSNPINARPVLLAAVGEELHSLPIHALAAALSERNIECHFLGARTPLAALAGMVSRCAPPAVFLWAQVSTNANPDFYTELPSVRPAPRVVLGGPGWDTEKCTEVVHVASLTLACEEIARAVGA
ncbi:unannotated protein [freshwater metagenome]|uniref:Unannotated protein n=1 Tax=freshwater metagenome TaxID=449393 RepID=A0A6J7XQU2_9ZZZZ|nr:hypothetical protein [Actinomycetota bacterium]